MGLDNRGVQDKESDNSTGDLLLGEIHAPLKFAPYESLVPFHVRNLEMCSSILKI